MAMNRPFVVNFLWGGRISFQNGWLSGDETTTTRSFVMSHRINYLQLNNMAYNYLRVSPSTHSLKMILWYIFNDHSCSNEIVDDQTLEVMYFLAGRDEHYQAHIEIQYEYEHGVEEEEEEEEEEEPVAEVPSFTDLLQSFGSFDAGPSTSRNYYHEEHAEQLEETRVDAGYDDGVSTATDYTVDHYSVEENVSDDSGREDPLPQDTPVSRFGNVTRVGEGSSCVFDVEDDGTSWVRWVKESNDITQGMVFQNKAELIYAVRRWNIQKNRELFVVDSRPGYWKARCYTTSPKYRGPPEQRYCSWSCSGSISNKSRVWKLVKWNDFHNCYGNVMENNNRCLTSSAIASEIDHLVRVDVTVPVANIQAVVKRTSNVDVSYHKAWNARRIAIERLYGTWDSNFAELPTYLTELLYNNPDTIVRFFNDGPTDASGVDTFKYVFWAFGPTIAAYKKCVPIICIDGTHLKGSYEGKLLMAVAKNANNQVLPVAFAIVDNETNHSWTWFLQLFRVHVVENRKVCVISDRHPGILHAMGIFTSEYEWEHRYCLRHIRSNLLKHCPRIKELKALCWTIGETTNRILFLNAIEAIKRASPVAWKYLKDADVAKWTIYRDPRRSRWGNTTTNIAECFNNVMNRARMMPIKSMIEYTFDYTVRHFVDQYREAYQWEAPLTKKMWKIYNERELRSQTYLTTCYDFQSGVFRVRSTYQRSGEGGTDYTVEFNDKKCSCGRWQHQRLPCSHAISVCSHLQRDAQGLASKKYTTTVWREQYNPLNNPFRPLRDKSYWSPEGYINPIRADASRLIRHRGRKKTKRIRNQMDERERQKPKCSICKTQGHNKNTCPSRN